MTEYEHLKKIRENAESPLLDLTQENQAKPVLIRLDDSNLPQNAVKEDNYKNYKRDMIAGLIGIGIIATTMLSGCYEVIKDIRTH